MDESADTKSLEPQEEGEPKVINYKKHLVIGGGLGAFLLIAGITAFFILRGGKPAHKPDRGAAPQALSQPAVAPAAGEAVPTRAQQEEAKRVAEAKRLELIEIHRRVLSEDASGKIDSLSQKKPAALPLPDKAVPEASPEKPPVKPKEQQPEAAKTEPPAGNVAADKKPVPAITPLGRQGYGVSKENVEGLPALIDAMNQAEARKDKKR